MYRPIRAMMGTVTVIRINAVTVPESGGKELARRFAERAGAVDSADGFEPLVRLWASSARGIRITWY